jgi:hypothetical protein
MRKTGRQYDKKLAVVFLLHDHILPLSNKNVFSLQI